MGEVYRAKDVKLGREIAIKVLPAAVAGDHGRRQRFEQEARSASALNHPNILTVYDIGEADGALYIAMELVEGKTLRELLASGEPLPTRRLLDLSVQIAEGLAKAHGAGIVHRDLKPENLMVSKDGYVKILDFGLAKLTETPAQDVSVLPTAIAAPTEPGTVMGTAGYMSPEQASGQPVDFRSDQFSFGAILYELATGQRAFQRKTGAETLVAIIREEPEPLAQTAPKSPAPVRWIVERCLAKDPEERYASTKDLARDLKNLRDHLTETSASGALAPAEPARTKRRGRLALAAATLLIGVGLGFLARSLAGGAHAPLKLQRLTYARGSIHCARFAPDGQTIIYSAAWEGRPVEIFSTRADSTESRSLGLTGADLLAVSSQGELALSLNRRHLFGFETAGTLARVPLAGGAPREVLEDVEDADWAPDGKTLAVVRLAGNTCRLEYPIGKVLFEAPGWISNVRISPDGRSIAFVDHPQKGDNNGSVKVVDVSGKLRFTGPNAQRGLAWSPGGEIWSTGGDDGILATSLSGKTRQTWNSPGVNLADIGRDGRVLFQSNISRREIVAVSGQDGVERNLTWFDWSFPIDLSRDGRTLLFMEQNIQPPGVYLRKLDGSPAVRLGDGYTFGLSPDGRWALASRDPAKGELSLLPTGPGEQKDLSPTGLNMQGISWIPNTNRVLISGNEPGRRSRLWVLDVSSGKPRAITPEGVSVAFSTASPDDRWIVALGPDRRYGLYPLEPGEPRPLPGLDPDEVPVQWSPDGRSVVVYRPTEAPLRVELFDVATGTRKLWKEIRPPDPSGVAQVGPILISWNTGSYVYSYRRSLDDLYLATGLK